MRVHLRLYGLACFVVLASLPAEALSIAGAALGSSLAGGVVTVTRFGGVMSSATFVAAGTGASATAPGSAGFTLTVTPGDTGGATWELTNTDPSLIFLNRIVGVVMDLTLSGVSLFDDGSLPSTPVSGTGVAGVSALAGVAITASSDFVPWTDAGNLGDMYYATSISFGGGFTALAKSSWTDDTDLIVPEPAAACLIGIGLAALGLRGRR